MGEKWIRYRAASTVDGDAAPLQRSTVTQRDEADHATHCRSLPHCDTFFSEKVMRGGMRKLQSVGAVLLVSLTAGLHPAFGFSLNYTMINNTNEPIVRIWSSLTTESKLYESTNAYVAASGGRQKQTYSNSNATGSNCFYDIRVQFQGGTTTNINHVDLCKTDTITIDVRNGRIIYTAE